MAPHNKKRAAANNTPRHGNGGKASGNASGNEMAPVEMLAAAKMVPRQHNSSAPAEMPAAAKGPRASGSASGSEMAPHQRKC
jgi:hypothetical protein